MNETLIAAIVAVGAGAIAGEPCGQTRPAAGLSAILLTRAPREAGAPRTADRAR